MKRGRGRPSGPANIEADRNLVGFVADRPKGMSIRRACEEYKRLKGRAVGTVAQLFERHRKIKGAYPGEWHVETVRLKALGGYPVQRRVFGSIPSPGVALLTGRNWPTRKPSR